VPKPKEKPPSAIREPRPKTNRFGLKVPPLERPHRELIPEPEPSPVTERRSETEPRSASEPRSEPVPNAVQRERRSEAEPRSLPELAPARIHVDRLLRVLTQDEATLYLRLYRLAAIKENGVARGWCAVGAPKLVESTKIKRTALFAAIRGLEEKGLIRREAQEILRGEGGGRGSEGNRYRVFEPDVIGRPVDERRSDSERRSQIERSSAGGLMKVSSKNDHERAPVAVAPAPEFNVYDVRRIAARFRELHHGESDYTKDRLRADVRTALIGEGREPDERLIDEAIGA
jgi:hypothetical protein